MVFHHLQGFQVGLVGGHNAVRSILAHAIHVVGACLQVGKRCIEWMVVGHAVVVGSGGKQLGAVVLGVIVLVEQFGEHEMETAVFPRV